MDEQEPGAAKRMFKTAMKFVFSHVGLCVLVCAYCVGGAKLFQHIELDLEKEAYLETLNVSQTMEMYRRKLSKDLWRHKGSQVFNVTIKKLLDEYHANLTAAIGEHGYAGTVLDPVEDVTHNWDFSSALLFTVTIVTTIGYGHVAPSTELGQLIVIFYSLLGIPLMLMFLANIGDGMANFFRTAYGRGCCYFCFKQRKKNYDASKKRQRYQVSSAENGKPPKDGWALDDDEFDGKYRSRSPSPDAAGGEGRRRRDSQTSLSSDGKNGKVVEEEPELELDDPEDEVVNVPISLTLVIIVLYLFIGAAMFAKWNDWSWITGAYFCCITLSTIGLGDLVPGWDEMGTTIGQLKFAASSVYIVLGLAVLSMSFNLMMEEMIAKFRWIGQKLGIVDSDEDEDGDNADDKDKEKTTANDKAPLVDNEVGQNNGKGRQSPPPSTSAIIDDTLDDGIPQTYDEALAAGSSKLADAPLPV